MIDLPLRSLTSDELETFSINGVVCARQVMPQRWLDVVARAVEHNIAEPTAIGELISMTEQGFLNDVFMWLADADYRSFIEESPISAIAGQVLASLGSDSMRFFYDQTFVKEPGTQVPTPWHHDLTFWPLDGWQICSIWMPLDPVTDATSGLQYVKGSHRWPNRFKAITPDHNEFMLNPELEDVPDIESARDQYDLASWDMDPGDVLIFHPLVLHGSGGNQSIDVRRRALATRWLGDDVVYQDRPHTLPMPPGNLLVHGEAFTGPHFPAFAIRP